MSVFRVSGLCRSILMPVRTEDGSVADFSLRVRISDVQFNSFNIIETFLSTLSAEHSDLGTVRIEDDCSTLDVPVSVVTRNPGAPRVSYVLEKLHCVFHTRYLVWEVRVGGELYSTTPHSYETFLTVPSRGVVDFERVNAPHIGATVDLSNVRASGPDNDIYTSDAIMAAMQVPGEFLHRGPARLTPPTPVIGELSNSSIFDSFCSYVEENVAVVPSLDAASGEIRATADELGSLWRTMAHINMGRLNQLSAMENAGRITIYGGEDGPEDDKEAEDLGEVKLPRNIGGLI